jgi:hypothetical protein
MEKTFLKFCDYYLNKKDVEELKKQEKLSDSSFKEYKQKSQKFVKNIKRKTKKLGFGTDFDSFCNMLEHYIKIKDDLNDLEKREYLKQLVALSEIYDINLRKELEQYISYKEQVIDERAIFFKFCHYNIEPNSDVKEFNRLKEISEKNKIDFITIQEKAILFVEETKTLAKNIGYGTTEEDLNKMVKDYVNKKANLNDLEKTEYLRVMLYLSEIYNVNLREELMKKSQAKKDKKIETLSIDSILNNLSDPLTNKDFLEKMLVSRYHNGYFNLEELINEETTIEEKYEYYDLQAELLYKVYSILLTKYNNYNSDDLNSKYTDLLNEENCEKLKSLELDQLKDLIKDIDNDEPFQYINKKYDIDEKLLEFISTSYQETLNLKSNNVGSNSLFNSNEYQPTISIYISGPEYDKHRLLNEYIKRCIELNISYLTTGLKDNPTILYANIEDILTKINILNEIIEKNSDGGDKLCPVPMTSQIKDSYYTISEMGILKEDLTYIDNYFSYINYVSEIAYYRTLAKIVVNKIEEKDKKQIINNFINLKNVSFEKTVIKNPILAEYNDYNFTLIKDIINNYIPGVSKTIGIYMNDKVELEKITKEFIKSIKYICNIVKGLDKKENSNITIGTYLINYI